MAFEYSVETFRGGDRMLEHLALDAQTDESRDRQTEFAVVDVGMISENQALLLHPAHPFEHRGGGQTNAASQFGQRYSGVFL